MRLAATNTFDPSTKTSSESSGVIAVTSRRRGSRIHTVAVPAPPGRVTRTTPVSGATRKGTASGSRMARTGSRNLPRGVTSTETELAGRPVATTSNTPSS